ncbi:hypothetical protein [Haloarcula rara]|nr:hypothetical protein [Halomicroarcula sp. SHR3]
MRVDYVRLCRHVVVGVVGVTGVAGVAAADHAPDTIEQPHAHRKTV